MSGELNAVIVHRGKWYVGYVPEIPGVNSQGRTVKELRENLREALELILQANAEFAELDLSGEDVIREPFAKLAFKGP